MKTQQQVYQNTTINSLKHNTIFAKHNKKFFKHDTKYLRIINQCKFKIIIQK